ncbi:unnamed protein product [Blepharisma stoltei]|uniref:F-box domain-containing protein n=1 Tax=Blepharisma stoltei TaxID=1481888 RepID=A0AAU9IRJ4_9CILI|nr:unnamed protein product [Blepharisma stoltei]
MRIMKETWFLAEDSRLRAETCDYCSSELQIGYITIWTMNCRNYHLWCFKPEQQQYIYESDLTIRLTPQNQYILSCWLETWNEKFLPKYKPFDKPPKIVKTLNSQLPNLKRAWTEILKFIDPFETLNIIALVSKSFYELAWNDELWCFYCSQDYGIHSSTTSWKNCYALLSLETCVGCRKYFSNESFYRCPFLKKPICSDCRNNKPKYKLYSKKEIFQKYGINPIFLNLNFARAYPNRVVTYQFMAEKAIWQYRRENKRKLLEILQRNFKLETYEYVENLDIFNMEIEVENIDKVKKKAFNYVRSRAGKDKMLKVIIKYAK